MKITNEIIEDLGFKRINNSMWREGNVTLQNDYINDGGSLHNRIITSRKAYKVCINGKFKKMVSTTIELTSACSKNDKDLENNINVSKN